MYASEGVTLNAEVYKDDNAGRAAKQRNEGRLRSEAHTPSAAARSQSATQQQQKSGAAHRCNLKHANEMWSSQALMCTIAQDYIIVSFPAITKHATPSDVRSSATHNAYLQCNMQLYLRPSQDRV